MYENATKIHRKGNAIAPKLFEILYLRFKTSNLKSVFPFCEKSKLVSFEVFGKFLYLLFQSTLFFSHVHTYIKFSCLSFQTSERNNV